VDHKIICHLQDITEEMEKPSTTPQRWRALNRQFHGDFYALSDSAYLLDLIESVWRRTEPYLAIYAINVGSFSEANEQHRDILQSIRVRDLNSLQEKIQQHMRYTCEAVCRVLASK
jgi:DNA-binding GntR family transcriptional regulator